MICKLRAAVPTWFKETLLDAHKDFDRFTGRTEQEFLAWLQ
jgi:hypothetical protein